MKIWGPPGKKVCLRVSPHEASPLYSVHVSPALSLNNSGGRQPSKVRERFNSPLAHAVGASRFGSRLGFGDFTALSLIPILDINLILA